MKNNQFPDSFPDSLINDQTKVGKHATLVHQSKNELFLSLENGILILQANGSWEWSPR